jgi:hypothetical protein
MRLFLLTAAFSVLLAAPTLARADCSTYSDCGHPGARYSTCAAYKSCIAREQEASQAKVQARSQATGPHKVQGTAVPQAQNQTQPPTVQGGYKTAE